MMMIIIIIIIIPYLLTFWVNRQMTQRTQHSTQTQTTENNKQDTANTDKRNRTIRKHCGIKLISLLARSS